MDVHSNELEGTNEDMVAQDPLERAQEMLRKGEITKEEYESLAENIVSQDPLEKAKRMLERGEITQEEFESLAANMTQDPLDKAKRMLQRGEITQEDYEILASQLGGGTSWLSSMKEKVVEKKKKLSVSMQRKHFQQPSAPEAAPQVVTADGHIYVSVLQARNLQLVGSGAEISPSQLCCFVVLRCGRKVSE